MMPTVKFEVSIEVGHPLSAEAEATTVAEGWLKGYDYSIVRLDYGNLELTPMSYWGEQKRWRGTVLVTAEWDEEKAISHPPRGASDV